MFVDSGIIYLFIINRLINIQKMNLTKWDLILLYLVIYHTLSIIIGIFFNILSVYNIELEIEPLFMVDKNTTDSSVNNSVTNTSTIATNTTVGNTSTTTVTQNTIGNNINEHTPNRTVIDRRIILDNGAWSEGVRSVFIYGGAGYKLYLLRGGSPRTRFIITSGALATDLFARVSVNIINDPNYIKNHVMNWKILRDSTNIDGVTVDVTKDQEFMKNITQKFLPENFSLDSLYENILGHVLSYFEAQKVDYPVDLLMDQHHFLSIFLYILIILLFIFILTLGYMTFLLVFREKILSFFQNKFILLYFNIQYKIMYIEYFILSGLILYDFYMIIKISHFLCTYPIDVSINKQ